MRPGEWMHSWIIHQYFLADDNYTKSFRLLETNLVVHPTITCVKVCISALNGRTQRWGEKPAASIYKQCIEM